MARLRPDKGTGEQRGRFTIPHHRADPIIPRRPTATFGPSDYCLQLTCKVALLCTLKPIPEFQILVLQTIAWSLNSNHSLRISDFVKYFVQTHSLELGFSPVPLCLPTWATSTPSAVSPHCITRRFERDIAARYYRILWSQVFPRNLPSSPRVSPYPDGHRHLYLNTSDSSVAYFSEPFRVHLLGVLRSKEFTNVMCILVRCSASTIPRHDSSA